VPVGEPFWANGDFLQNQTNKVRDDVVTAIRFPIRLLTVTLLLTILTFGGFGWIAFDARRDVKDFSARLARIEQIHGVIVHLDEVLTMSARMAAATGDLRWEARYREFEPQLDAAIKEATKLTNEPGKGTTETYQANVNLVAMENQAFSLIHAGRKEDAGRILFSPEYENQKGLYAAGENSFTEQTRRSLDDNLRDDQRVDLLLGIAALLAGGISFLAWFSTVRGMQRWRRTLERTVSERAGAERSLRRARDELEVRVQQRTAELAATNNAMLTENAERVRSEGALRESEERYRELFENAKDAIYVHDLSGRYISANRAALTISGYTLDEILGRNFMEFLAPESAAEISTRLNEKLAEHGETTYEIEVIAKNGRRVPIEVSSRLIYENGEPVGVQGTGRDITERKRAEGERQAIAEIVQGIITTSSLDELFKLAHNAISKMLPAENCFVALYDKATDILQIPFCRDEFDSVATPHRLGKGLTAFVLRSGRPAFMNPEMIRGLVSKGEIELVGTLPAAWLGVPLRTSTDTIGVLVVQHYEDKDAYRERDLQLLASVADQLGLAIERKQIEIELRTNEIRLTEAQHIANLGNWEWDIQTHNVRWSNELYRIFGVPPETLGSTFGKFLTYVHPDDRRLMEHAIQGALHDKVFPNSDFRIVRPDGTLRAVQCRGAVVVDATGKVTGMWGTVQDITERKRTEKEREVISEVIQSVNLTSNLDELLRQVHQSLKGVLYAENCCVVLFDKPTGLFQAPLFVDLVEPNPFPVALSKSCVAKVFRSGQPLLMNQAILSDLLDRGEIELIGRASPSFLAVPLMTPAETIGVIVVQHYERDNVYSEQDQEFLSAVAAQLALAIERKQAEEALIESDRRFRDLFYDAPVGYHELDTEGRITCVNTTELSMLGYSSEEMIGHHVWDFIEESEIACATFAEKLEGIKPRRSVERSFRRKDGTWMQVQLDDRLLNDPSGRIVGIRATMQDIAERKRAEAALIESERRFRDLFENASDVIYTADLHGNFTSLNRSGERMTGYTRAEALHLNFSQVVSPETLKLVQKMSERKLKTLDETVYELEFLKKGGEPLLVEVSSRAIFENGKPVGIQGIGRDITERKRIEAELKRARDAAIESSRIKSEFLANMSHEIRTPMNGILGMTELTLDTTLDPDQREYLEIVKSSTHSLLTIINDILDFSKIEAGKLDLEEIDFNLHEAVGSAAAAVALHAHEKGLKLIVDIAAGVPDRLVGDPGRLQQVVVNLIGNAVKFTDAGEIAVRVAMESETEDEMFLHVSVSDTGIGIPAEKQDLIFGAFAQADGSTTRRYGGTGLGLAICSQLVEIMGGRIWVESTESKGSTFHFTARFGLQAALGANAIEPLLITGETGLTETLVREAVAPSVHGKALHFLLAEDNDVNQKLVVWLLQKRGHSVTVVDNGKKALAALDAVVALEQGPFDIILMDVQMPEMNGLEATKIIRQREASTGTHVPIIAMTALAMKGDRELCLAAGMDEYISKPIRPHQVFEAVERLLEVRGNNPAKQPGSDQGRSTAMAESTLSVSAFPESTPDEAAFHEADLLLRVDGSVELMQQLIELFKEEWPPLLAEIAAAIDHGNADAVHRLSHKIKGSAGIFGAHAVVRATARLEQMGRAKDLSEAVGELANLSRELNRLQAAMDQSCLQSV
jgi:PAS domain S-box-containing protein